MEPLKGTPYERTTQRKPPVEVERVEQKRSRRLSKPRTNSYGKGHLKPNLSVGDLSLMTKSSFPLSGDTVAVTSPALEQQDPLQSPTHSDGQSGARSAGISDAAKEVEGATMASRLQRTGTKFMRMSVRRTLNKSASTMAMDEFGNDNENTIEGYEWIKQKAELDRLAMMKHHNNAPGPVDDSEERAPIRRKSLLTPGLATRGNDILRKPPIVSHERSKTLADIQHHYYHPGLSSTSPLARIASLDNPGACSVSSLDMARAATPAELDYGRLGGLRITNGGAVSPAPSGSRLTSHPIVQAMHVASTDLAVAASKDHWSAAETVYLHQYLVERPDVIPTIARPLADDTCNMYAEDLGNPWLEASQDALETPIKSDGGQQLQRWPTVTSVYSQPEPADDLRGKFTEQERQARAEFRQFAATPRSLKASLDPIRPGTALESTSRMNEEDALLFEEDSCLATQRDSESPFADRVGDTVDSLSPMTRIEMSRILESMMAASRLTPLPHREDENGRNAYSASTVSSYSEGLPLSAVDSGYASTTSFRSKREGVSPSSSISQQTGGSDYFVIHPQPGPSRGRVIDQQAKYESTAPVERMYYSAPPSSLELPQAKMRDLAPIHNFQSKEKEIPSTGATSSTAESKVKTLSPNAGGKKLKKRAPRPKSMPPPVDRIIVTGQAEPEILTSIPRVPSVMAARHAERWSQQPYTGRRSASPTRPLQVTHAPQAMAERRRYKHSQSQLEVNPRRSAAEDLPPAVPPKNPSHCTHRRGAIHKARSFWGEDLVSKVPGDDSHRLIYDGHSDQASADITAARQHRAMNSYRRPATATVCTFAEAAATGGYSEDGDAQIDWEKYRRAWRDRRQSAGEALKNRPDFESFADYVSNPHTLSHDTVHQTHRRTLTEVDEQQMRKAADVRTLVHHFNAAASTASPTSTASPHPSARPSPLKIWHDDQESYFPGRYDGGLGFGYEPGKGIGGSAGTRGNGGQTASRKNGRGNLASGWGVDLSDVPVFIARG